jgi:diguanylate cyclase (GGDEF)-like protein
MSPPSPPSRAAAPLPPPREPSPPPPGWAVRHLRPLLLVPIAVLTLAGTALYLGRLHGTLEAGIADRLDGVRAALGALSPDPVNPAVTTLGAVADLLTGDEGLTHMLAVRDRGGLLARTEPMLAALRDHHGITSLTLAGPDGTVLARAHEPAHHGDRLRGYTAQRAAATEGPAFGLEVGPPGIFALRYVVPWLPPPSPRPVAFGGAPQTVPGRPIGYLAVGLAPEGVLAPASRAAGVPVAVLLQKDVVDRAAWEAHERSLGGMPDWDGFGALVPYGTGPDALPESLARAVETAPGRPDGPGGISLAGGRLRGAVVHLTDASGRHLGYAVGLLDVSGRMAAANIAARRGVVAGLALGALLLALTGALAGRVATRLAEDARSLDELATRDPLTGLYNHRAFYGMLEQEIHRAARFEQPVAVLMIDLDRFREVNDRHGHRAGDRVLACVAGVVRNSVRRIDPVCRYGGAELAIILPHTGLAAARRAAERVRERVAKAPCEVDAHTVARVTVSIGVAAHPPAWADVEALVRAADDALYAAKAAGRDRVVEAPGPAVPEDPARV